MATIPLAYWLGRLTYVQLLLVAIVVAGAKIAFATAGGAHLKSVVTRDDLLAANSRFESTMWSSIAIAEAIGRGLDVPAASVPEDQAGAHFGWLSKFAGADMAAASDTTRSLLGWTPSGPTLAEDLGSYL